MSRIFVFLILICCISFYTFSDEIILDRNNIIISKDIHNRKNDKEERKINIAEYANILSVETGIKFAADKEIENIVVNRHIESNTLLGNRIEEIKSKYNLDEEFRDGIIYFKKYKGEHSYKSKRTIDEIQFQKYIFMDKIVESAVREVLGKPYGEIFYSDLPKIHMLEIYGKEINTADISNLVNIEYLNLRGDYIKNLSIIKGLKKLKTLILYGNQIKNLEPISELQSLEVLDLSNNRIEDISALVNLINLREINISNNQVSNIDCLKKMTKLEKLYAWGNKIEKVDSIFDKENLLELDLSGNKLETIEGIRDMGNIELLYLSNNFIREISGIENMYGLKTLDLRNNKISNIEITRKLKKLKEFSYNNNPVDKKSVELIEFLKKVNEVELLYHMNYMYIKEFPAKLKYKQGERIDLKGLVINYIYGEDREVRIADNELIKVLGYEPFKIGEQKIRLSFKNCQVLMKVTVINTEEKSSFKNNKKGEALEFKNENMENSVRDRINKLFGKLYNDDIDEITYLDAKGRNINDIDGIKKLVNLNTLYLEDNSIENIEEIANLTKLETLDLENNKIKNIEPLLKLKRLKNLDLYRNKIENIELLLLLPNLENLHISFDKIDIKTNSVISKLKKKVRNFVYRVRNDEAYLTKDLLLEMILVREPDKIVYKRDEKLDLRGLVVRGIYDDKTELLNITDTDITGFESEKPGIKTLTIFKNGIVLDFNILVEDPQNHSGNEIVKFVDKEFLDVVRKLTGKISIGEQQTNEFSTDDFKGITKLDICDQEIENITGIENFVDLEELNMGNIRGTYNAKYDFRTLKKLKKLKYLDINNIDLTYKKDILEALPELQNLEYLDISNNKLFSIKEISSLKNLKYLNVGNNNIKDSELELLSGMEKLTYLDIHSNGIRGIKNLSPLVNIKNLILYNNKIKDLEILKNFEKLEHIDLTGNSIEIFDLKYSKQNRNNSNSELEKDKESNKYITMTDSHDKFVWTSSGDLSSFLNRGETILKINGKYFEEYSEYNYDLNVYKIEKDEDFDEKKLRETEVSNRKAILKYR